jgi:hypothetical protein
MATITGNLQNALAGLIAGQVTVQLCGYGAMVPRNNGVALFGNPSTLPADIQVAASTGAFTFEVTGNDEIEPAGTYYTVTISDTNGDVVQINAYQFLGSGTYDLNLIDPFDPTLPLPPLPPLIVSQLLLVPYSATPNFPGDQYTAWDFTLNGDVTSSTLSGLMQGNLYTFIISQGASAGGTFKWPTGCLNTPTVDPAAGSTTIQTFIALANSGGPLLPIGPATYFP